MTSSKYRPIILIVGMPDSIHTIRWINMVRQSGYTIVLAPVYLALPLPDLEGWRPVTSREAVDALDPDEVGYLDLSPIDRDTSWAQDERHGYERLMPIHMSYGRMLTTPHDLAWAVQSIRPDLVHTLEVQLAGYLTLETKRRVGAGFPLWLLSNWGSDIYLYERLPKHREVINEVMREIDGYIAECARDTGIAKGLGFSGQLFNPIPASGGADFTSMPRLADLKPPSARDTILVKGYHGWAGRGMHILSALHLAGPQLKGFKIRLVLASPAMAEMAQAVAEVDGLDLKIEPHLTHHADALGRLGRARMVVATGVSDGISTTLLEGMSLGVFPIQANTSCACEWVESGRDAFVVDPHDTVALARAIITAAQDDLLVDAAATRNRKVVEQRWSRDVNAQKAATYYDAMIRPAAAKTQTRKAQAQVNLRQASLQPIAAPALAGAVAPGEQQRQPTAAVTASSISARGKIAADTSERAAQRERIANLKARLAVHQGWDEDS